MSTNGNVALEAQKQECEAAIEDIKSRHADNDNVCPSHDAVVRGIITLLRVKAAEISATQTARRDWRVVALSVVGWVFKWAAVTVLAALVAGKYVGQ